jgi:hypothetical protein
MWRNYVRFFLIVNEKRHYKSSEDGRIPKQDSNLEPSKYEAGDKLKKKNLVSSVLQETLRE